MDNSLGGINAGASGATVTFGSYSTLAVCYNFNLSSLVSGAIFNTTTTSVTGLTGDTAAGTLEITGGLTTTC